MHTGGGHLWHPPRHGATVAHPKCASLSVCSGCYESDAVLADECGGGGHTHRRVYHDVRDGGYSQVRILRQALL
jgi:hypothetical protein